MSRREISRSNSTLGVHCAARWRSPWLASVNAHVGLAAAAFGLCGTLISSEALAWGSSGHRLIGELALKSLPPELPDFLRKAEAARQVAEVAREPDRAKGSSAPHDSDANAAHHVNVGDDLKIARGPSLLALPANRESYDTALRAAGTNQYRAGYLPYAIIDAWQQVVMDFAHWRADVAGARYAKTPAERSWFLQDQWVREGLTIRDLGLLAHFVGDGSQPMLVSIHSDGWGNYPNPQSFTTTRVRAVFEGTIVRNKITANGHFRLCRGLARLPLRDRAKNVGLSDRDAERRGRALPDRKGRWIRRASR